MSGIKLARPEDERHFVTSRTWRWPPRLSRLWWRQQWRSATRWWRPRLVVVSIDVARGSITVDRERWSWRRWRWERVQS